jgi:CheY-like chemotaxis protein
VRSLAQRILEGAGYTVIGAPDAATALRLLERRDARIDLLLTDVVLPNMSGRELADRVAATRPGLKVLYTSGYTDDEIPRHGVLDAAAHFVAKPYSQGDLTRKVREVLDS